MLGRRTAGAGFEQPATLHQRHDRQHLGARAEFQDREQIGQIVAQHVAGDRDRVLALADALDRELASPRPASGCGCRDPPVSWFFRYVSTLRDHLRVVRAFGVEPEHGRRAGHARAAHARACTQSWIGASLAWHMRKMSPASTFCSSRTCRLVDDADHAVGWRARTSCRASRTPRPPAPSSRRSARCPSWPDRTRRAALQSSMTTRYSAA